MWAMTRRTQRWVLVGAQAAVSLGLLGWLIGRIAWQSLWLTLRAASLPLSLLTVGLYLFGVVVSAYKWQQILAVEAVPLPLGRLTRWYLIGMFGNNFLPTAVGGDVGRGFYAGRATRQPLLITRTILLDRLSGLVMVLVLAGLGLPLLLGRAALGWLLAGAGLLVALALLGWQVQRWLLRLPRVAGLAGRAAVVAGQYRRAPGQVLVILALSLGFQLLSGLCFWLNLRAVQVALPLPIIVVISAAASLIGVLPIAINGWGVREGVFLALLAALGQPTAGVLAGLLLGRGLQLLVSLLGSIPLVLEGLPSRPPQPADE